MEYIHFLFKHVRDLLEEMQEKNLSISTQEEPKLKYVTCNCKYEQSDCDCGHGL